MFIDVNNLFPKAERDKTLQEDIESSLRASVSISQLPPRPLTGWSEFYELDSILTLTKAAVD